MSYGSLQIPMGLPGLTKPEEGEEPIIADRPSPGMLMEQMAQDAAGTNIPLPQKLIRPVEDLKTPIPPPRKGEALANPLYASKRFMNVPANEDLARVKRKAEREQMHKEGILEELLGKRGLYFASPMAMDAKDLEDVNALPYIASVPQAVADTLARMTAAGIGGTEYILESMAESSLLMAGYTLDQVKEARAEYGKENLGRTIIRSIPEIVPGTRETVPYAMSSALTSAAGYAGLAAIPVVGPSLATSMGVMEGGFLGKEDAVAAGATPEQQTTSALLNGVLGLTEAIPAMKLVKRLDGQTGGMFSKSMDKTLKRILGNDFEPVIAGLMNKKSRVGAITLNALESALEEGLQEFVQNTGGNLIAAQEWLSGYDPDRPLLDESLESAGYGGFAGAALGTLATMLGMRRLGVIPQERVEEIAEKIKQGALSDVDVASVPPLSPILQVMQDSLNATLEAGNKADQALQAIDPTGSLAAKTVAPVSGENNKIHHNALGTVFSADNTGDYTQAGVGTASLDSVLDPSFNPVKPTTVWDVLQNTPQQKIIWAPVAARLNIRRASQHAKNVGDTATEGRLARAEAEFDNYLRNISVVAEKMLVDPSTRLTDAFDRVVFGPTTKPGSLGSTFFSPPLRLAVIKLDLKPLAKAYVVGDQREIKTAKLSLMRTVMHELAHNIFSSRLAPIYAKHQALTGPDRTKYEQTTEYQVADAVRKEWLNWVVNADMWRAGFMEQTSFQPQYNYNLTEKENADELDNPRPRGTIDYFRQNRDYWLNIDEFFARAMEQKLPLLSEFQSTPSFLQELHEGLQALYQSFQRNPQFDFGKAPRNYLDFIKTQKSALEIVQEYLRTRQLPLEMIQKFWTNTYESQVRATQNGQVNIAGIPMPPPPDISSEDFRNWNTHLDKFNKFDEYGSGILHIAKENPHIVPVQKYADIMRDWANERGQRLFAAQETYNAIRKLGKERIAKLSSVLFEETLNEKFFTPEELSQRLDQETGAIRERIYADFRGILTDMETLLLERAVKAHPANLDKQKAETDRIKAHFKALKAKPYFPLMRFGKHALTIADGDGKRVSFFTFDTKRERDRELDRWKKIFKHNPQKYVGYTAGPTTMGDSDMSLQQLPVEFLSLLDERLTEMNIPLTEEQRQAARELSFENAEAKGFMKQFIKRKKVPGFSQDLLRAYAAYMNAASNHVARAKYGSQALDQVKAIRKQAEFIARHGEQEEMEKSRRSEIANWMRKHLEYTMSPENEWAGLRSAIFAWHLGFNLKTAALNSTQIMMVTYPYLAARYGGIGRGDARAVAALTKAFGQVNELWRKGAQTTQPELLKLIENGKRDGWLDESLATEMVLNSRADRMDRLVIANEAKRFIHKVPTYSAIFFHSVEKLNRQVTAVATFQLAREDGKSFEQAYREARLAVENTQFEYQRFNRARLFRGKASVVLMFMSYVQNILQFALRDPGAWRWWMMQLTMAGLMGLPGAEDLLDLLEAGWNTLGPKLGFKKPYIHAKHEIEKLAANYFGQIGMNPDLMLNGLSRSTFGLTSLPILENFPIPRIDLSGSMGMGDILPLTEEIRRLRDEKFEDFVGRGVESIGGAPVSAVFSVMKAIASDDPNQWRRWEKALPAALRSASRSARMYVEGGETTRRGEKIAEFDPTDPREAMELLLAAFGFQPTALSVGWEKNMAQREQVVYWKARKTHLYADLNYAYETGDREGIADALKAVKEYNKEAPFPAMRIGPEELNRSVKGRARDRALARAGLSPELQYIQLIREVGEVYDQKLEPGNQRTEK